MRKHPSPFTFCLGMPINRAFAGAKGKRRNAYCPEILLRLVRKTARLWQFFAPLWQLFALSMAPSNLSRLEYGKEGAGSS